MKKKRRERVSKADALAIGRRLNDFVHSRYDTWRQFDNKFSVPRTTRLGWINQSNPTVPQIAYLIRLAREENLNFNWLLLGEGPEVRIEEAEDESPEEVVSAIIKAELRQSEDVDDEVFEAAWIRMKVRDDWSYRDPQVLKLAVDAVRRRFQDNVRMVRHYRGLAHLIQAMERRLFELEMQDPARAKRYRRKALKLLGPMASEEALTAIGYRFNEDGDIVGFSPEVNDGKEAK